MKSQISKYKSQIVAILMLSILSVPVFAEDTIWNRIFFLDFQDMGGAVIENPVKTAAIAAGIGGLTYLLMKNDLWLSKTVRSNNTKFNEAMFNAFNYLGDGTTVLAADAVLFAAGGEKEKKAAERIVEGLVVSGVITTVIKTTFGRKRPSKTDDPYIFSWFTIGDASYPSGHTQTAFLCATIIGDRYDIGWITYPAAFMTGMARIYKSAHWPSDIVLGAVIGIVTGKVINNLDIPKEVSFTPELNGVRLSYSF